MQLRSFIIIASLLCFNACASKPASSIASASATDSDAALNEQAKKYAERETLREHLNSLTPANQERAKALAAKAAKRGREYFKKAAYKKASFYFSKSLRHDPTVDLTYYEYAVTLYKLGDYRNASYYLNMLESSTVDQTELHYYQALVHYKLKENEYALSKFKAVRDDKDVKLSPLAAMYAGIIEVEALNYTDAKKNFEFVLDTSKDPALDKRAEASIESILRLEKFQEQAKKRWAYSLFAGAGYDGNVLNAAITNAASGTEAYRLIYGGSLSYKALYTLKHSLAPQLWVSDMYSVDKKFKSDATIQSADPLQAEFSVPYKRYMKSGTLTISPAYQVLYMSLNQASRELVFNTAAVSAGFSTSYAAHWITDYRIDIAKDNSHIEITNPEDDQSSLKYTALFSQTRTLDDDGYKSLTLDLMYTKSDTDGDNFRYTRMLGAFGGGFPLSKSRKFLGFARLDYYTMDFADSSTNRKDDGLVATFGTNYILGSKSTVSVNVQYYDNSSNVPLFDYDKFVITGIYNFSGIF